MAPGSAREFIQPHYTPIPTSPSNTGMSLGGIGNALTATPAGVVTALHFIPGLYITPDTGEAVGLMDFYCAEFRMPDQPKLTIRNFEGFKTHNLFYPLSTTGGLPIFKGSESPRQAAAILNGLLSEPGLISSNEKNFNRWRIRLSPRTKALKSAPGDYRWKNFYFLLDFFGGMISRNPSCRSGLTARGNGDSPACTPCRAGDMRYQALYPMAETEYHWPGQLCRIVKQQFSPIVPGEEMLCALPVVYHVFHLENPVKSDVEVTLLQIQENISGNSLQKQRSGVQDAAFIMKKTPKKLRHQLFSQRIGNGNRLTGIHFSRSEKGEKGDFTGETAIAALTNLDSSEVCVTAKPEFYSQEKDGVIAEALHTGRLNPDFYKGTVSGREQLSGALCVSLKLQPGEKQTAVFTQVLDFPFIDLPGYKAKKRYTHYFPHNPRAKAICRFALESWEKIRQKILSGYGCPPMRTWRKFLGQRPELEKKLFTLMQNTLSFLAEASVWDSRNKLLVRECADYPFFNSLDVYFYGSFAVSHLLPSLDARIIRDFADAVLSEDKTKRRYWIYSDTPHAEMMHPKFEGPRSVKGAVVHDLGSTFDTKPDAYIWHNVKEWKDLAPKFVLMVWRNYRDTGDKKILRDCLEAVEASLDYLIRLIPKGAAIPPTNGCDDTFDNLPSFGVSVYCASLWIAGLKAAEAIFETLEHSGIAENYRRLRLRAEKEFQTHLWDEEEGYYHFCAVPIYPEHVQTKYLNQLMRLAKSLGIHTTGDGVGRALKALNTFLCQRETALQPGWIQSANQSIARYFKGKLRPFRKTEKLTFLRLRTLKKLLILGLGEKFWQPGYRESITQDSDSLFGDQLLADTYLQLTGLIPITSLEKRRRVLKRLMETSFKTGNPRIGIANLVDRNGGAVDSFQAQDVWIGVQYSNAAALISAGMNRECFHLLETVYTCLYEKAKIPFAAPEGFNGSVILTPEILSEELHHPLEKSGKIIAQMKKRYPWILDKQGRISPNLPEKFAEFKHRLNGQRFGLQKDAHLKSLHALLKSMGLQYTAGRYFRPGMVFALPRMLELI